jgi:hypothetical protein
MLTYAGALQVKAALLKMDEVTVATAYQARMLTHADVC